MSLSDTATEVIIQTTINNSLSDTEMEVITLNDSKNNDLSNTFKGRKQTFVNFAGIIVDIKHFFLHIFINRSKYNKTC